MLSKNEIRKWLLENCVDRDGDLNLMFLDFSDFDGDIYISHMIVKGNLYQNSQEVKGRLEQSRQKVDGDLTQSQQRVDGDLEQGRQEVKGDLFEQHTLVIDGKKYEADKTDGLYVGIIDKQVKSEYEIIEFIARGGNSGWLYKKGDTGYHAPTKELAKEGLRRKLKKLETNLELVNSIKEKGYITKTQYQQLTGACEFGIDEFKRRNNLNTNTITINQLLELLKPNDYGFDKVAKYFKGVN